MSTKKHQTQKAIDFNVLEQIQPDAAGIDVGASELYVCVPLGRDEQQIKSLALDGFQGSEPSCKKRAGNLA